MSGKNWDRVPIDAQSIDAPLSQAAIFLVVTIANEETALAKACSICALSNMTGVARRDGPSTVMVRRPAKPESLVTTDLNEALAWIGAHGAAS